MIANFPFKLAILLRFYVARLTFKFVRQYYQSENQT